MSALNGWQRATLKDAPQFLAAFGAITGALSLVGVVLALGMYKERIDRHERWFNLLVEESLMRAWKSGTVERGSWKSKPEFIGALLVPAQEVCKRVAQRLREPDYTKVANAILRDVDGHVSLADLGAELGLTPMELLGALVTSTAERIEARIGNSPT